MNNLEELLFRPICKRIVEYFLERLGRKGADERSKRLSIAVEKKDFPEIYNPKFPGAEDEVWREIELLEKVGIVFIEYGIKKTSAPKYARKTRLVFRIEREEECREILGIPTDSESMRWRKSVENTGLPSALKLCLKDGRPIMIEGKTPEEIVGRITLCLGDIKPGMSRRQASAILFWGLSKMLDGRQELSSILELRESPIILNVRLPEDGQVCNEVVFVENYDTYLQMSSVVTGRTAIAYSAGFSSSAGRIRQRGGCALHYMGKTTCEAITSFEEWLFEREGGVAPFFFGDLDYSGISIYAAMRKSFSEIEMYQKMYERMLNAIRTGSGHTPLMAGKENQIDPVCVDDEYCDSVLLPAIRQFGFYDQEGIC